MVYGDLQFFDIVVFAVIAVFLVFRLKNVLGKRTGFQKNPAQNISTQQPDRTTKVKTIPELDENNHH